MGSKTSTKKGEPKQSEAQPKAITVQEPKPQPEKGIPSPEDVKAESTPTPEKSKPAPIEPKLSDIKLLLDAIMATVLEHTKQIAELQETLARKRRPVASNGKIQIRDKQTGKVYPSKNSVYQSLLKAGELKDLVDKGIFGDVPQRNNFGWYILQRQWPNRFEELKAEQAQADGKP